MSDGQIKVELQEWMGSDRSIAESAWTSSLDYQKKQSRTDEDVARVVKMLANLKHSVPFESIIFKFWIRLPIAADRQLTTHRVASHSGQSARYRTMPSDFLTLPQDVRDIYNKITSKETDIVELNYLRLCRDANDFYQNEVSALRGAERDGFITNADFKRAREFLRGVLPQHNMTERVTVINLRSFANFIKLRLKPEAQPEIREVARLMLEEVKRINNCPLAIEWLEKNGWQL